MEAEPIKRVQGRPEGGSALTEGGLPCLGQKPVPTSEDSGGAQESYLKATLWSAALQESYCRCFASFGLCIRGDFLCMRCCAKCWGAAVTTTHQMPRRARDQCGIPGRSRKHTKVTVVAH